MATPSREKPKEEEEDIVVNALFYILVRYEWISVVEYNCGTQFNVHVSHTLHEQLAKQKPHCTRLLVGHFYQHLSLMSILVSFLKFFI